MTRAQTLILALLALHVLLGALSLVIARGEHRSPALRWWGWGLLTYGAGLATTVLSNVGVVPPTVAGIAGNSLVALAPVLCAQGIVAHTHYRISRAFVAVALAVTLAVLVAGNLHFINRLAANIFAPAPIADVLFLFSGWVIARHGPRDAAAACRFLGGICVFTVSTWIARDVVMIGFMQEAIERERIDIVVSLFAILQMINGVAATLALFWIDVRLMQAELSRVAHSDALTGLPNRRAVRARFAEECSRAARAGQKFAIAVFDIDHFKRVNDTYGHALGDEVLKAVSKAFAAAKRSEDVLGRIGGEEFLVILGQQSIEGAREAADRLRHAVAAAEVTVGADRVPISVSGGVGLYPEDGQDWDHLFATADRRLYAAKAGGRNRVESQG